MRGLFPGERTDTSVDVKPGCLPGERRRSVNIALDRAHFILGRPGPGIFPRDKHRTRFLLSGMIEQTGLSERIVQPARSQVGL